MISFSLSWTDMDYVQEVSLKFYNYKLAKLVMEERG